MSINQYYTNISNYLIPTSTAGYWATGAMFCDQGGAAALTFNLNNNEDSSEADERLGSINSELEQEKLFEKSLTPSDVGKLNRLVIPKQHAEKYFPLSGGGGEEKGLLLGFEDEGGKPWRFRYSYWNSSQSYVLTKGWSRFVKEKQLNAGDVVLFARHRRDFGRFFIGWRKRNESGSGHDGGGALYPAYCRQHQGSSSVVCQTDHASNNTEEVRGGRGGNSKRLRLFGVNLEWPEEEESAECYTDHHHHHSTWI